MKKFLLTLAGLGIAAAALPAAANAAPAYDLNHRQARIEHRIDQGVRSGTLSPGEARHLRGDLRRVGDREVHDRYSARGLNRYERHHLNRRLNRLSHRVYADKHDYRHRW